MGAAPADAVKTASGLASKVFEAGSGTVHPDAADKVTVHYTGWTTDGRMFDSSVIRKSPATLPLNGVISGRTEGLQLVVEGERRRFWIPGNLAYGDVPKRRGAPAGTPDSTHSRAPTQTDAATPGDTAAAALGWCPVGRAILLMDPGSERASSRTKGGEARDGSDTNGSGRSLGAVTAAARRAVLREPGIRPCREARRREPLGPYGQGERPLAGSAVQDGVLRTQGDASVGLDDASREGRGHREPPQGRLRHPQDSSSRRPQRGARGRSPRVTSIAIRLGLHARSLHDERVRALEVDEAQLDEKWAFVNKNFHHLHRGLRLRLADGTFVHRTPAMVMGIEERPLAVADILTTQIVGFTPPPVFIPAQLRLLYIAGHAP